MTPARVPAREVEPAPATTEDVSADHGPAGPPTPGKAALPPDSPAGAPPAGAVVQPARPDGEGRTGTIQGMRGLPAPARPATPRPDPPGAGQFSSGAAASPTTVRRTLATSAASGLTAASGLATASDRVASSGPASSSGLAASSVVPPERPTDSPDPGDARSATRPRPVRRRLLVGSVGVGQILCVQAALLAVVSRLGRENWITWSVDAVAGLVVVLALVPIRGRWLYQHLMTLVAFMFRRHRLIVRAALTNPSLLPGMALSDSVISTLDLDDSDIGLVEHPRGVTVVLGARSPGRRAWSVAELLERLPLPEHDLRVQMLVMEVPSRTTTTADDVPFLTSYSDLAAGRPAYRETWFAVQAPRTPACHTDEDMAELVGGILRGVQRRLAKERIPLRLLATAELTNLFRTTMRIDRSGDVVVPDHHAADDVDGPESITNCPVCRREAERRTGAAQETFVEWRVPGGVQACFAVAHWPAPDQTAYDSLLDTLVAASGTGTVLALATRPATDADAGPQMECAIRLWADESTGLAEASRRLTNTAEALGVGLDRHNGNHRARVNDTLPFGGFVT